MRNPFASWKGCVWPLITRGSPLSASSNGARRWATYFADGTEEQGAHRLVFDLEPGNDGPGEFGIIPAASDPRVGVGAGNSDGAGRPEIQVPVTRVSFPSAPSAKIGTWLRVTNSEASRFCQVGVFTPVCKVQLSTPVGAS